LDNLKKCASILSETFLKANRSKINLDIFPAKTEPTNTAPQLDDFDAAFYRHLRGEGMPKREVYTPKPKPHKKLTFEEALQKKLDGQRSL
jgi:hypothetical protein